MKLRLSFLLVVLAGPALSEETFDCVIEPAVTVRLASPVGGLLDTVRVSRGDVVSRGDEIARLRSEVEETSVELFAERARNDSEILAQRARLKLNERRVERLEQLVAREIAPKEQLEEAEAGVEVAIRELALAEMRQREALLEYKRAQEVLKQRVIRSPIEGVVLERSLFSGEYADSDAVIASIAMLDPLFVETFLPVGRYDEIEIGTKAIIDLPAPFASGIEGRVTVIDQVLDAASGSFGVRVEVANPDFGLPAGQRCRIGFSPSGEPLE